MKERTIYHIFVLSQIIIILYSLLAYTYILKIIMIYIEKNMFLLENTDI